MRTIGLMLGAAWLAVAPADGQQEQIDEAFSRARQGNYARLSELVRLGPAAAEGISRYLQDPQVVLRIEAVGLLQQLGACGELQKGLTNDAPEVRARAARAFFEACGRKGVNAAVAADLRKSISMGTTSPAALLLLSGRDDAESLSFLRKNLSETGMLKWDLGSQPVPQSLAASVALLGHDEEARAGLAPKLKRPTIPEARFFLDSLPFIDARWALEEISRLLADARPIPNESRRRICDYAVVAFAQRLQLKLPFKVRDYGRYSPAELEEVRRAVSNGLKNLTADAPTRFFPPVRMA